MSQQHLVDDLKQHIASGHVVVVVGTGVSVATCENQQVEGFQVATWTGLLKHGVHFCQHTESVLEADEAQLLEMQINLGKTDFLISAAEFVTERLCGKRPGAFRRWLKDSVGKLAPTQPDIIQTLASWPITLATLNYDRLIGAVTSRQPITWQDRDKIEDVLRYGGDAVIHLHGYFDQPDSVILGLSSYAKVANDPHTQAVLQLFTLDRTLLFVGCGGTFQDPNFSRLIEWGREALKDSTTRHFVLCQESEKAKFVKLQETAPWLYPIVFGAKHEDLLPFLRSLAPAATPSHPHGPPPKPPPLNLTVYAKAVRDRYAKLKLESLYSDGCYYQLELRRVFVPQHVRECQEYLPQVLELPKEHLRRLREADQIENGELDVERIQELRRRYLEQTPRNALELVGDPALPKVVILGDPGAGKSCLLQALTLHWAEQPELERRRLDLPLLIELRAYAQARERDHINGFLDFWQRSPLALCQLDSQGLRELLETGRAQVFFDGLDEVFDPASREEVANVIQHFANDFPRVRIVITSRVIGYKGESFRSADFRHFMLQELDDDQITTFLDKWHSDTYRPTETAERDEKHVRLIRAITDSRSIRELAGNPLLLTMMAILNRHRDLPRDRAELYEECSKLLLQQWKVEDALRADPDLAADALAIGLREKQDILRRLARAMQTGTNGPLGNLIATDRLETIIEDAVKSLVKGNPRAVARALIRHLRERNFILCFAGGDSYAFVHRTFLEYFCADDLRVRFEHEKSIDADYLEIQVFGPHWPDETWHEVLCLVAGMIHPNTLANILEYLLAQSDSEQPCQHIFLAARCVGEVRKGSDLGGITDIVKQRLAELVKFDFRYSYESEDDKISFIHTQAVTLLANIWRTDSEVRDWLKVCAQTDEHEDVRWAAVEALVQGWKDDPDTLPWLKARAQIDENELVRAAAVVKTLAQGWKDDPDTLPWLKTRAQTDENGSVRRIAAQTLAQGWKDDPDTLPWLKAYAQTDKNEFVRQAAVQALARGWKDDPDILPWLKARAQTDKNEFVRQAAVQALARGWKDHPDTLPWLKTRAQTDKHGSVRRAAVQELARGWKDDPDTMAWLETLAPLGKT
ncbi:MAG: HEAT repeat domain-containing protein [Candidatus Contendobacter sp.]|nr:HEAT repeat domain-containing protein [Candidatus Contendobacter sp.]MDS4057442.1 HEAT repeat domain-containing protein [Candidatus Contendobacter sp.]